MMWLLLLALVSAPLFAEDADICALHPEILACQGMGSGDEAGSNEVQNVTKEAYFSPERSATGSCPSPQSVSIQGKSFSIAWDPYCDFAEGIRPFAIVSALLGAGIFVFGAIKGAS